MIVLDEQLSYAAIRDPIAKWYPGAVSGILDEYPNRRILDPEIPGLLLRLRQPTFVTINYRDFFGTRYLHAAYCLVCLKLEQREAVRVPAILRTLLRLPDYRTKALRMGKVISWTETEVTHFTL